MKFYATKWVWIVSVTVIGIISGYIYSNYIQTPLYKSDATLLVVTSGDGATAQNTTLINNYVELFKSRRVLESVISKQKLDVSYDDLLGFVEATNSKNTQVVKVSISTKDARTSQSVLKGAIESFRQQVADIYTSDNIRVVDDASLAYKPYNIREVIVVALAGAAGLVLAIIALFFVYDFNLSRGRYAASDIVDVTQMQAKNKKTKKKQTKDSPSKEARSNRTFASVMQSLLFGDASRFSDQVSHSKTEPLSSKVDKQEVENLS